MMSLVPLAPGDDKPDNAAFPAGRRDANTDLGQQLDLRQTNSWTLKLEEVSTAEMAEVLPTAYRLLLPTGYYYYSPLATRHSPLTTQPPPSPGVLPPLDQPRHHARPRAPPGARPSRLLQPPLEWLPVAGAAAPASMGGAARAALCIAQLAGPR